MSVSAADVKALRDETGAGMMDAKQALVDTSGDVEEAKKLLREKGLAAAGKRAGRTTSEGLVEALISDDEKRGVLVEVQCETDFVAKGERFARLAADVAGVADEALGEIEGEAEAGVQALVEDAKIELQENIEFARAVGFQTESGLVHAYLHKTGGWAKKGVLIEVDGDGVDRDKLRDVAHEIALHIQFARPAYLETDEVDAGEIESEKELAAGKARAEGKPDEIAERIAEGMVKKLYKERVLTEQPFVRDDKVSVAQWLAAETGGNARIVRFARFEIGE